MNVDPERSEAAKRRAPPPNWHAKWQAAQREVSRRSEEASKLHSALDRMARITALQNCIMAKQDRLAAELSVRWFRSKAKIAGLEHDIAQLYVQLTHEEGA